MLPGQRLVARVRWRQTDAVLKLFAAQRHAAREHGGLRLLQQARLPVPRVLHHEPCVLIIEWLAGSISLGAALRDDTLRASRRDWLVASAQLIARMHAAGLQQRDMHLDNFLVGARGIHPVDGAAVTRSPAWRRKSAATRNFAQFLCQLPFAERALLPLLLGSYTKLHAIDATDLRRALDRQRRRRAQRLARKACRECSEFVAQRHWHRRIVYRREHEGEALARVLADPDAAMREGVLLKDGNSATVVRVTVGQRQMVIKRYNVRNWRHAFGRCWRDTRAWCSWRNGARLGALGIATPKPVAVIERRWGPLRGKAYYISDFVDGSGLGQFLLPGCASAPPDWIDRALGTVFNGLAAIGFSHGDCKASNFLVGGETLYLLDLDAMRGHCTAATLSAAQRRDRRRFVSNWRGELAEHFRHLLEVRGA